MFERKAEILTWFGEHFTDNYTKQTAAYGIIADLLTTIEVSEHLDYERTMKMKYEIQDVMRKYLKEGCD